MITPLNIPSRQKRIIEAYEAAHVRAFPPHGGSSHYVIPHQVLRDYLDVMADIKRKRSGLHNKTITVTINAARGLLDWNTMVGEGIAIRVEGQKWR